MERLFERCVSSLGRDGAAMVGWAVASTIWVLAPVYVNEAGIDAFTSNLSRALGLLICNFIPVLMYSQHSSQKQSSPQITGVALSAEIILVDRQRDMEKNMWVRHLLLTAYSLLFAQVQFYLPLPVVHTIYSSGPLFILLIDYLLSNKTIDTRTRLGVASAFLGVLLTTNGSYFNSTHTTDFQHYQTTNPLVLLIAAVLLAIATAGWSYAVILVRYIPASHYQLNFHFGMVMVFVSGCLFAQTSLQEQGRITKFIYALFFQGIPLGVGQAFFTYSLKVSDNSGIVSMVGFLGVVISYGIGVGRYHEDVSWVCVLGSILVVFGVWRIVVK